MTVKVLFYDGTTTREDIHERVAPPGINPQVGVVIINNLDGTPRTLYGIPHVVRVETEDNGIVPATVVPGNFGGKVS